MTTSNQPHGDTLFSHQLNTLLQATHSLIRALSGATVKDELLSGAIAALSSLTQARYGAITLINGDNIEHRITYGAAAMNKGLTVPIATGNQLFGQIDLCDKENSAPFNDVDEQLVRNFASSLALVLDNIQQRQAKERAEEQIRLHAKAFENSAEAVIITDHNGRILSINQAFTRITGYTLEEVADISPSLINSNKQRRSFYMRLWQELQEHGYWHGELVDRRKSGETFPAWLSLSAIKNSLGLTTHYVGLLSDISERKRFQKQIQYLAYYDSLTNLPNRALFIDRTRQLVATAKRSDALFAIMSIDIDHFKNINDTHGHTVGDKLLHQLATRLLRAIRAGDTAARLGGDKFGITVGNLSTPEDAAIAARNILSTLARPFKINKQEIYITGSIGISSYPTDGHDATTLIKHAEAAMFHAKSQQRDGFQFYQPEISAKRNKRLRLESELRQAIDRNEFVLHYQPKVDLKSWHINSVEALIRWQHPQQGMIQPNEFIPLLEETGLINQVGEWVLRSACAQINSWLAEGVTPPTVAINVSAHQFERERFIQILGEVLAEDHHCARYLEIEITESTLMNDAPQASEILHTLRAMGVHISVDDFGTGYSSLAYLSRFPIDTLKIDRTFIKSVTDNQHDATITRSMVDLAHNLGLRALAEGIETKAQLDFLTSLGCDSGQGFLFSRPVAITELTQKLRHKRVVDPAEYC
jgi:diguanylate cyclase (GGDEF)-like protein/PAS domain S-box-containing protein